jgi:hypothetical protein
VNKKLISFLSILLITLSLFGAKANPAWFTINTTQGDWLANNDMDMQYNVGGFWYLGHIDLNIDGATSKHSVTMIVTSPFDDLRLNHTTNSNYYFPTNIVLGLSGGMSGNQIINSSPFSLTFNLPGNNGYVGANFQLNIPSFGTPPDNYAGTYVASYRFRFFIDYGTADEIELTAAERVFSVITFYKSRTPNPSGSSYFTNLIIDQYSNAENIDVNYMQQNNTSMLVGAVTFGSNDNRNNAKYKIKVSPGENVNGDFSFHKTGATPIPYKAYILSRTQPATKAFTVNVPGKGTSGYYQDYFELGISNVNQSNVSLKAGEYSSQIRIDLIVD